MNDLNRGVLQQLFVDQVSDCALVLLDLEGKILSWNTGAARLFGYTEQEVMGQNRSCIYSQADINAAKPSKALEEALLQGRYDDTAASRTHKNGTTVQVQDVVIPLYDAQNKLVAFGNMAREFGQRAPSALPQPVEIARKGALVPFTGIRKVLLVDDDEDVRLTSVNLLTSLGYEVLVASSGVEALEILARVEDIDVLFTDVVMPGGMDGGAVAKTAKLLRPGLKILFASGYFEGALIRDGSIEASAHFLVKPYRKRDLAKKMEDVLAPM